MTGGTEGIIAEIEAFSKGLFAAGKEEPTAEEERLLFHLLGVNFHRSQDGLVPPLMILETFLLTHEAGHQQFEFVLDWLHSGLLEYHSTRGDVSLEHALGLKHRTRTTPFSQAATKALHQELAIKMHFLHTVGKLTVEESAQKIGDTSLAKEAGHLRNIYYKHQHLFPQWDRYFEERPEAWRREKLSKWGVTDSTRIN